MDHEDPTRGGPLAQRHRDFLYLSGFVCLSFSVSRSRDCEHKAARNVDRYTNKSVDNVLCGLLDSGFTDLARVGSLRAIAPQLLPYVATASSSSGGGGKDGDVIRELREILKDTKSASDRARQSTFTVAFGPGGVADFNGIALTPPGSGGVLTAGGGAADNRRLGREQARQPGAATLPGLSHRSDLPLRKLSRPRRALR